ncbi:MAG: phosphoribosylanthranilate isomerase [Planctomycetota bacterium]|jgi:phosphoribosylanthranilate isomerase
MTRTKICGITSPDLARIAVEAGADAIGMVIDVPHSPRSISFETAEEILRVAPAPVMSIAVVQDPDPALADRWPGTWFQLHGDEDEALVGRFARAKHVIKGFRFDPQQVKRWNDCPHVEILLIDGSSGGRGETFRHEELAALMPQITKPVVLAGGLTPQNVGPAIRAVRPFAVDVSSGVETSPGVKDPQLIKEFCAAVVEADRGT